MIRWRGRPSNTPNVCRSRLRTRYSGIIHSPNQSLPKAQNRMLHNKRNICCVGKRPTAFCPQRMIRRPGMAHFISRPSISSSPLLRIKRPQSYLEQDISDNMSCLCEHQRMRVNMGRAIANLITDTDHTMSISCHGAISYPKSTRCSTKYQPSMPI